MRVLLLTCLIAMSSAAAAAEIKATSAIDSVTVYPDGAAVTRVLRVDLPAGESVVLARDFPLGLDPASLRVEGESGGRIQVGSIDARPPGPQPVQGTPEREKKIQALEDDRAALDDRISAAGVRKAFARRFATDAPLGLGEESNARPLSEWREAFKAIEEEISRADETIRALQVKKREIEAELAILHAGQRADPPNKMEVRIELAAQTAAPATLRVSYSVRDARWRPLYDARLDTGGKDRKPSLELVRRAEIVQRSGEDWANVALAVSTVRTGRGGSAPNLSTVIVRYPQPVPPPVRPQAMAPASRAVDSALDAGQEKAMEAVEERSATVETGGFQALFRIPGRVSLGAGEGARSLRIASTTVAADLLVRAAPVVDDTAWLEATFKQAEEAPLLPGQVGLYRDGIFVGRGKMVLTQKDETVRLGFGADEQVKVARAVVRKNDGTAGLITASKTDEREFKIVVRNAHVWPMKVTIEEQLPVAENSEIQVEMLPSSTQPTHRDVRDQRGVMAWTLDMPAGETREVKFGWRVRWPSEKSVVFIGRGG
ncbi:mucoidy inhibitor MuiA family protein [Bradyrhizobium sp. LHD-71]|uniref:mucoidy inhibitor MuiA family protein n=1 Tax=Bradyrhizobium sp. LHD-71 TaxID=3072141 RepID=UPI00280EE7EA|nr:mucoidy inhibitor MuiA family protein [Bradyrhizobium sp. LHD-71]MDQ8726815.1 mucoidy inhibitor MuiA family protein [Bradyrhizobium sp. LHD-71]